MLYDPKWEAKPDTVTKEVLVEARRLIGRPEDWCQEFEHGRSICAVHALQRAVAVLCLPQEAETLAYDALAAGMGVPCSDGPEMGHWNDAPGRTHAEVLAAFDRAIEVA